MENHDDDQEVNPENYEYKGRKRDDNVWMEKVKRRFKENTNGCKGCPNKWNVFHICTVFCLERWGNGIDKPTKKYKDRFQRLLERYPLPKKGNWVYIWDSGCEAYYFWNKSDNLVSWLPPKHPKAVVGKSASNIRSEKDRPDMEAIDEPEIPQLMSQPQGRSPPQQPQIEERYQKPLATKKNKSRDLEKILRTKKGRRQFYENSDVIDPMDPASYSEIPKGRWSAGLGSEDKAADSTASGRAQGKRKETPENSDEEPEKRQRYEEMEI